MSYIIAICLMILIGSLSLKPYFKLWTSIKALEASIERSNNKLAYFQHYTTITTVGKSLLTVAECNLVQAKVYSFVARADLVKGRRLDANSAILNAYKHLSIFQNTLVALNKAF